MTRVVLITGWRVTVSCIAAAVVALAAGLEASAQQWAPSREDIEAGNELPPDGPILPVASQFLAGPVERSAQLPTEFQLPVPACGDVVGDIGCYLDPGAFGSPTDAAFWQWRLLPAGVVWQSYWAGVNEPRISGVAFNDRGESLLDVTLGGRAALLRYGSAGPGRPVGLELQIEGAGIPRLHLDENWDLEAADFRFGVPLVYGREKWQSKLAYYHLSSHMGDEFAIRNQAMGVLAERINYSRDVMVLALAYYPLPAWRWYAEAGWAFHYDESEPWEFQFGVDVAEPGPTDFLGTPFIAVNGHLREEVDFGGHVVFQAGWLWRGETASTMRLGFHYLNGKSTQLEFNREFEEQIGGGLWYDF